MPRRGATAEPLVEYVPLEIDGKTWQLAFDFNALANAEKAAGCNLLLGLSGLLTDTWTAAQVRGLLYAALLRAHPETTVEQAGAMVIFETLGPIQDALILAYDKSLPEGKKLPIRPREADGENKPPAGS